MKKSLKILYTVLSVIVILLIIAVIAINLFADSAVNIIVVAIVLALSLIAIGQLWIIILAFRESFLHGICSLFHPFAFYYAVTRWSKCKRAVILACTGTAILATVFLVHAFVVIAVKMAIESAGSKALQVGVAVDDVDLSILGGKIGFQNLVIDNPPGYKYKQLLELNEAKITVETGSLFTDIVNIKDIRLDGLNVVLEQRGITSNNLQDIMKSLPTKEAEPSEPGGKKLHIDNLEITNAQVKVKLLPLPGKIDTLTLKLAPIKMTDLGGENDIDTVALVREVLLALAGGIAEQGAGILPEDMLGSLTSQLGKLGALPAAFLDKGGKLLGAGKDVGGDAIKGAGGATKGITDGIKGLFKPKEDKE